MTAKQLIIEQTYERERPRLLSFIRSKVSDEYEAEDILQDVFTQLVHGIDEIKTIEKVTSWLYSVSRNKIADHFRKSKNNVQFSIIQDGDENSPLMLSDILPSLEPDPDSELFSELIWEKVEEALSLLPEEQKEVFVLNEFEDKSFKEISVITGAPVNTLLSRKRYAILFLRSRLKELYNQL